MLGLVVSDIPLISWYVLVLVFLEGLLSADNALVLALMVRHLPKRDQRKVLRWGIWGAIAFRFLAVVLSAFLLKMWVFKVLGGGYLLYLAAKHFLNTGAESPTGPGRQETKFWGTVAAVTFTDIAFSIDSILAAVAMADDFPARFGHNGKLFIVFVGGVLGIITMRFVVRYFVILLDRFPGLAQGAYVLVAWIGLKLVISGLHSAEYNGQPVIGFHMPEWLFWSGMLAIAVLSFLIQPKTKPPSMAEELEMLDEEATTEGMPPVESEPGTDPPAPDHDGTGDLNGEIPSGRSRADSQFNS